MSESEEKRPDIQDKSMGQIVTYLKDYPFLLITIAGLLILAGILIFDLEKLKEFKVLVYAVVLVPLAIQFFIELKKMGLGQEHSSHGMPAEQGAIEPARLASLPTAPSPPQAVPRADLSLSRKALLGLAIIVVVFFVIGETPPVKLHDPGFAATVILFSLVAGVFGFLAWRDAKGMRVRGKALAITDIFLSGIVGLGALGWLNQAPPQPEPPFSDTTSPAVGMRGEAPSLQGIYRLQSLIENGQVVNADGALQIATPSADAFPWQVLFHVQGPNGGFQIANRGVLFRHGSAWTLRVTESSVPGWVDQGEVPIQLGTANGAVYFRYAYGGNMLEHQWIRNQ